MGIHNTIDGLARLWNSVATISVFLLLGVFTEHTNVIRAHVIWKYPAPRPSTSIKSYPCGSNAPWATGPVTTLKVGLNEVVFDEYVCHAGDMVRIALSMGNDDGYDDHVLLDRLPHNDDCRTFSFSNQNNLMAVNITLPDVDCVSNECSLQVIQVMSSKFKGSRCENPAEIAELCGGNGRMYYSCARVIIEGTANEIPLVFNDYYGQNEPVDYEWPLVEDWCRDEDEDENGEEVPWRLCEETPQADFSFMNTVVDAVSLESNTLATAIPSADQTEFSTSAGSVDSNFSIATADNVTWEQLTTFAPSSDELASKNNVAIRGGGVR